MRTLIAAAAMALAAPVQEADPSAVLQNYGDIALAKYEDSLTSARDLQSAIDSVLKAPDQLGLDRAKGAWLAAGVDFGPADDPLRALGGH